jgi:hypothetical protein
MRLQIFILMAIGCALTTHAQVTLFRSCEFMGTRVQIGEGSIPRMRVTSIGNDNLSSFRLTPGYTITVFEDEYFKGKSATFQASQNCLEFPLRNNVSSIIIARSNNNWGGGNQWGFNDGVVTIFRNCEYQGSSRELREGSYESLPLGFGRNISSIRISRGLQVELFQGPNFTGKRALLRYDDPCFPADWNDRVSSMRVSSLFNNQPANNGWDPWSESGAGANNMHANNSILFFGTCDYRGSQKRYGRGDYPQVFDNSITSAEAFRIPRGMTIEVYNQPNYRGRKLVFQSDVDCLPSEISNKIRSMRIY